MYQRKAEQLMSDENCFKVNEWWGWSQFQIHVLYDQAGFCSLLSASDKAWHDQSSVSVAKSVAQWPVQALVRGQRAQVITNKLY